MTPHLTLSLQRISGLSLAKLGMDFKYKKKVSEENREFNSAWTHLFAFTVNVAGLPVCLVCSAKLANNKKCNVEIHFENKYTAFAERYSAEDERKRAEQSKCTFKNWIKSPPPLLLLFLWQLRR